MRHAHSHPHYSQTEGKTIPWASFYDLLVWFTTFGQAPKIRRTTIELAKIKPGEQVLDTGCGTGELTFLASERVGEGGRVVGIDASPQMIERARKKYSKASNSLTFNREIIEDLPFEENTYDVVLNSLVMHHLPDKTKQAGLKEIFRVLKPGGRVLLVDMEPNTQGHVFSRITDFIIHLHGGHRAMQNNLSKIKPFLRAAGFEDLEMRRINSQICALSAKKMGNVS